MAGADFRGSRFPLTIRRGSDVAFALTVTDDASAPIDLSSATIAGEIYAVDGTTVATFSDPVSGAGNNVVTLSLTDTQTAALTSAAYQWTLWVTRGGDKRPWFEGNVSVTSAGSGGTPTSGTFDVSVDADVNVAVTVPAVGGSDAEVAALVADSGSDTRAALNDTYVAHAPAPNGTDDTTAIQALLDAAETAGGGTVRLRAATWAAPYIVTGLSIGTGVKIEGVAAAYGTVIKLKNGSNANVIESKDFAAMVVQDSNDVINDGVPYGLAISNLCIDGNSPNNSAGHGIAIWALRYTLRNIFVYQAPDNAIHSDSATGSTGGYPEGQIEPIIENIWIRDCGGIGLNYLGPNDGRIDNVWIAEAGGNGFVTALTTDVGFIHVYGSGGTGVVLGGVTRAEYIESENNEGAGLIVTAPNVSMVNKYVAFNNWKSDPANAANWDATLGGSILIGNALVNTEQGCSGITVTADRCGIGHLVMSSTTGAAIGLDVAASKFGAPNVDIYGYSGSGGIGIRMGSAAARYENHIVGVVSDCATGLSITNMGGNHNIDLSIYTSSGGQTPWSIPTVPNNTVIGLRARGSHSTTAFYGGQYLYLGGDANLYRSAAAKLKTDGQLEVTGAITATAGITLGSTIAAALAASGNIVHAARVTGDAQNRFDIRASGQINWGSGTAAIDTNLYRRSVDQLKTDDMFLAALGIGVGNSASATTPGTVVKKMQVFDANGASLGYIPIYDAIT